jgi:hypothetical protein
MILNYLRWFSKHQKMMKEWGPLNGEMPSNDDVLPVGYKHITCHMIFEIKMFGLVRKAHFMAGGHMTDPLLESFYSSVMFHESVWIMFLIAALNDLEILGADIRNAYINAKRDQKFTQQRDWSLF